MEDPGPGPNPEGPGPNPEAFFPGPVQFDTDLNFKFIYGL